MTLIICEQLGVTMADILAEKDGVKCVMCNTEVYHEDAKEIEGKFLCWLCIERIKFGVDK